MQIQVTASDANNIICQVTPTPVQTVTIDRGVAGNGIVSIVPVTIGTLEYLRITYTNGTISDVGPITSTAYTATSPINIVGNTISLLTVPVNLGGTGATTAAAGIQNLLPSYTGNGNKRLGLNSGATALEWVADGGGTVTSVSGAGTVSGLTLTGTVTTSGSLTLGGTLNLSAYNGAGAFTTLSASGAVTLSGGTANGVAYLNGSKVLTTGSALTFDGTNFATTGSVTSAGLSDSGNLTFTGTGNRITGDFTNATLANRVMFQNSVTNAASNIQTLPNGTSTISGLLAFANSDPANTSFAAIQAHGPDVRLNSGVTGTGTYVPLTFYTGGSERVRIDTSGNVGIGTSSPGGKLDVFSSAAANVALFRAGAGQNSFLSVIGNGNSFLSTSFDMIQDSSNAATLTNRANAPLLFATNNTERMRIDSSGNVGIGTSSPSYAVDIRNASSTALRVGSSGNSFGSLLSWDNTSGLGTLWTLGSYGLVLGTNGTERARIDTQGNLTLRAGGSTTTTHVFTFNESGGEIQLMNASGATDVLFDSVSGVARYLAFNGSMSIGTTGAQPFIVNTSGVERARIDSSGNLGLGVTPVNAYGKLQALASGTVLPTSDSNVPAGYSYAQFSANSGAVSDWLLLRGPYGTAGHKTGILLQDTFYDNTAYGGRYIQANGQAITFGTMFNGTLYSSNGTLTEHARIDSSGNLLVGLTVAQGQVLGAQIRAAGDIWSGMSASTNATSTLNVYSTGAAAYRFYVGMAGTVYATSTTITAISDQRLKENIRDLDDGLDVVMALKPRKFDWKEGRGENIKNARGFIAQEFEQVLPDMIHEWRDAAPEGEDPYKAVNANLIPTLVKAIQEQQAIIKSLKARLDAANL